MTSSCEQNRKLISCDVTVMVYEIAGMEKQRPQWLKLFLSLGLSTGTVTGVWKTVGIPTGHMSSWCNGALGNPNLYLDQPITKGWCHVSYPTDSLIATKLGLCSSLTMTKLMSGDNKYEIHGVLWTFNYTYRQVSNIRRTKSQHFKDSRTVLQLSLPNPLKPDVKSRMKM